VSILFDSLTFEILPYARPSLLRVTALDSDRLSAREHLDGATLRPCQVRGGREGGHRDRKRVEGRKTIQGSALFHAVLSQYRYLAVLRAACLKPDLLQWDHADYTVIGDRGVGFDLAFPT